MGTFVSGGLIHGFVNSGETFTTVDVPGSKSTIVTDINTAGDMCGIWLDANNDSHGFVSRAGIFTSLDFPAGTNTQAAGINASGVVVGIYDDANDVQHGFTFNEGTFTSLGRDARRHGTLSANAAPRINAGPRSLTRNRARPT